MSLIFLFTSGLLLLNTALVVVCDQTPTQNATTMNNDQFVVEPIEGAISDLGEGPHWQDSQSSLYYVDAFMGYIHRYQVKENKHSKVNLGDLVTIVIPIENENKLLVSLRNKVCSVERRFLSLIKRTFAYINRWFDLTGTMKPIR